MISHPFTEREFIFFPQWLSLMPPIKTVDSWKCMHSTKNPLTYITHNLSLTPVRHVKGDECRKKTSLKRSYLFNYLTLYTFQKSTERSPAQLCILSQSAQSPLTLPVCVWMLYYLDREREREGENESPGWWAGQSFDKMTHWTLCRG